MSEPLAAGSGGGKAEAAQAESPTLQSSGSSAEMMPSLPPSPTKAAAAPLTARSLSEQEIASPSMVAHVLRSNTDDDLGRAQPKPLPPSVHAVLVMDERRSSAPASLSARNAVGGGAAAAPGASGSTSRKPTTYLPWGEAPSPWSLSKPPSPVRAPSPWSGTTKPLSPWSTTESRSKIKAVPVMATHAYMPRKGALAYLERCAKCNKPEAAHKVVSPNQIKAAENDHLWLLRDLLVDAQFGASRRVKVLRSVAATLRDLHKQGRCFGQALTTTSVLVDAQSNGLLRRPMPEPKRLDPYAAKHEERSKEDVARFGRLARQVFTGASDQAVLDATSLGALCEQCECDDAASRPEAEGTYEWLDSVLSELAVADDEFAPKSTRFRGFVDIVTAAHDVHDELSGYDSDDSFFPLPGKARDDDFDVPPLDASPTTNKGAMASASGAALSSSSPALKRTGSVESKLNSFLASTSGIVNRKTMLTDGGAGGKDDSDPFNQARRRRRSLDAASSPSSSARPKRLIRLSSATKLNFRKSWTTQHGRKRSLEVPQPNEVAARFDKQERLSQDEASAVVLQAENIMRRENNVVRMPEGSKVLVFGDIHGQYYDLRLALQQAEYSLDEPDERVLLLLGDYVDRGAWSCEVWLFLLALKVARPSSVFLLRGNHECAAVVSFFGFKEECETKYGTPMFHRCVNCFQAMPLAALVCVSPGETWLCCHGGLSPRLETLADVEEVDRYAEPGMNGLFCDLLWADPAEAQDDFTANPSRGCSVRFSEAAATRFLNANGLAGLVRGHEVVEDGVLVQFNGRVITVFSAPNYCGRYGNRAAYLSVANGAMVPCRFDPAPQQPEPLEFESVSREVNHSIAQTCPYMPTTLQGFVTRALDLWSANAVLDKADVSAADAFASASAMGDEPRPARLSESRPASRLVTHDTRDSTRDSMQDEDYLVASAHDAASSPFFLEARKKLARAFKSIMPTKRFQTAKLADGINEAHPTLTHLKLQSAEFQLRMREKKMDNSVATARDTSGAVMFSEGELRALLCRFRAAACTDAQRDSRQPPALVHAGRQVGRRLHPGRRNCRVVAD